MIENHIISSIHKLVKDKFYNEATGHDYFHIQRVRKNSLSIAENYDVDIFVVEVGALLHDIADHKFHDGNENIGSEKASEILQEFDISNNRKNMIIDIVKEISFMGLGVSSTMSSLEGEIVQDADRLDAIGAIGIARTFAYGGSKKRPIYMPDIKPVCHTSAAAYKASTAPTINHFYEKLLHLKDKMNTDYAKKMAEERHIFMESFLKQFYKEWGKL